MLALVWREQWVGEGDKYTTYGGHMPNDGFILGLKYFIYSHQHTLLTYLTGKGGFQMTFLQYDQNTFFFFF